MSYWTNMSPRERMLIIVAGFLTCILLVSLLIVRPVIAMQAEARAAYEDAAETYVLVQRAAQQPRENQNTNPSALRTVITDTASGRGIIVNRINSNGAVLDISLADTEVAVLYGWIAELERNHNVIVRDATIRPAGNGRVVSARLGVVGGGA